MSRRKKTAECFADCIALLANADKPMTRGDVQSECELHESTVRHYLGLLENRGLVRMVKVSERAYGDSRRGPLGFHYEWTA